MIVDFIFGAVALAGGLLVTYGGYSSPKKGERRPAISISEAMDASLAAIAPPQSDTVTLVIELLRSDNGWNKITEHSPASATTRAKWIHDTGVRVTHSYSIIGSVDLFYVYIQDEKGEFQIVELTQEDQKVIKRELEAFDNRQRNSRQRELARLLAQRVVAREANPSGYNSGRDKIIPPADEDDLYPERREERAVPSAQLTIAGNKIIASGERNGGLKLSEALESRYKVASARNKYANIMSKLIEDRYDY